MSRNRAHVGVAHADVVNETTLPVVRPTSDYPPAEEEPPASVVQLRPRAEAAPQPLQRTVDVFLRYLKAEGVTHVFGIVGGLLYPFFVAVENDPELALVHVKHEEGAAFM